MRAICGLGGYDFVCSWSYHRIIAKVAACGDHFAINAVFWDEIFICTSNPGTPSAFPFRVPVVGAFVRWRLA
jgi:hypothetical protein